MCDCSERHLKLLAESHRDGIKKLQDYLLNFELKNEDEPKAETTNKDEE